MESQKIKNRAKINHHISKMVLVTLFGYSKRARKNYNGARGARTAKPKGNTGVNFNKKKLNAILTTIRPHSIQRLAKRIIPSQILNQIRHANNAEHIDTIIAIHFLNCR